MNAQSKLFCIALVSAALSGCDLSPGVQPDASPHVFDARPNPDQMLTEKVKRAMEGETLVGSQGIEVTVTNGTVQLWGLVDSTKARKRAEQIAAGVVGVRSVDSRLKVDPGA